MNFSTKKPLILGGLLLITLSIPLTIVLLRTRQELRKGAAGPSGAIEIVDPNSDGVTSSRNVTLTLTVPISRASLLKIPHAHAATACGDVNEDGYVNMGDVSLLQSYVGYPGQYTVNEWVADVNCNGSINMGDVSLLHSYVSNPNNYQLSCCSETPTPTPGSSCVCGSWQDDECGGKYIMFDYHCPDDKIHIYRTCVPEGCASPDECCGPDQSDVDKCVYRAECGPTPTPKPTEPPCSCTAWEDVQCGGWVCADDAMHQHRDCTPTGCGTENRCPWDERCAGLEPTPTPQGPTPTPIPLVTHVMISNSSNFSDGQTKSWPFSASSWTIPWALTEGDGQKTVYAKFKWSDGTWTSKVSDSITLQTADPTPTPTPIPCPQVSYDGYLTCGGGAFWLRHTKQATIALVAGTGDPPLWIKDLPSALLLGDVLFVRHVTDPLTMVEFYWGDLPANPFEYDWAMYAWIGIDKCDQPFWMWWTFPLACGTTPTPTPEVCQEVPAGLYSIWIQPDGRLGVVLGCENGFEQRGHVPANGRIPAGEKYIPIPIEKGKYYDYTFPLSAVCALGYPDTELFCDTVCNTPPINCDEIPVRVTYVANDLSCNPPEYTVGGGGWNMAEMYLDDTPYGHCTIHVEYTGYTTFFLTAQASVSPQEADLNENGEVEIGDFSVFVDNYGESGEDVKGDLNKNGAVEILDYSMWLDAYREYIEK